MKIFIVLIYILYAIFSKQDIIVKGDRNGKG